MRTIAAVLVSVPILAQPLGFEKISVRPAAVADPRAMRFRVLANGDLNARSAPLLLLLQQAYDVPANPSPRLTGLPDWRDLYDIDAKAPGNLPSGLSPDSQRDRMRMQLMLRQLLADRFKLVMHVDMEMTAVYALTVASDGPKLQTSPLAENDCIVDTATADACHSFAMGFGHPLRARAITMDDLVEYIENWADRPVVNRTALNGLFLVETTGWKPMRLPPPPPGNPPTVSYDDLPSIFAVLRPLGLELRYDTATVPFYTVQHVERPVMH